MTSAANPVGELVLGFERAAHPVPSAHALGELPVALRRDEPAGGRAVRVRTIEWLAGTADLDAVDACADTFGERGLAPSWAAGAPASALAELVTRCQRWLGRRNRHTDQPGFEQALAAHAGLHDRSLPLVRADHDHALDAWQWMLRLDPDASTAAQLAILFHDVERLVSEAERRIEHHATAYRACKRAHAVASARMAERILGRCELSLADRSRAVALIAACDDPAARDDDDELTLVEEADALSFLSLDSAGFLDYHGPSHTRTKLAFTLARLGPRGRARLAGIRLRADVARLFDELRAPRPGGEP